MQLDHAGIRDYKVDYHNIAPNRIHFGIHQLPLKYATIRIHHIDIIFINTGKTN